MIHGPRRVAIEAVGLVSPCGLGLRAFEDWHAGGMPSCIGPIDHLEEPWLPVERGGTVRRWDRRSARELIPDRKALKLMTRPVQLGLAAALMAWPEGAEGDVPPERRGMYVGAGVAVDEEWTFREPFAAATTDGEFSLGRFAHEGHAVLNPLWLVRGLSNNVLAFASLFRDLQGPNDNFEAGAAGALQAVCAAGVEVAWDRLDRALAGGVESGTCIEHLVGLFRQGAELLPGEAACFVRLGVGQAGDFGLLSGGHGFVPGPPDPGPWAPVGVVARAAELVADAGRRAGRKVDAVLVEPRLWTALLRDGAGPLDAAVRGDAGVLNDAVARQLGDAGAGSGALLLAAATALRGSGQHGNIALAAAGPGGEVAVLLVGTLA